MQNLPHHYQAGAEGGPQGEAAVVSPGLPRIRTAPPAAFGGPGDQWSPETLLLAAVADCLLLNFRAVAAASRLPWRYLSCRAEGVLDRVGSVMRYREIVLHTELTLPADGDHDRARRVLEKAERSCPITASLVAEVTLMPVISVQDEP